MTTLYESRLAAISRSPVDLAVLTLDYCARTHCVYPCEGNNLITNGHMEADANWSSYGVPVVNEQSAVQAHTGSYSRHFVTMMFDSGIQSDPFTVVAGTTYSISFWIYPTNNTIVYFIVLDGDGNYLFIDCQDDLTQNAWNQVIVGDIAATVSGAAAAVIIYNVFLEAYIDDVVVIKKGRRCYNTYFTCNDKTNYSKTTKDYLFASADIPAAALGFYGSRPYISEISDLPTEISDNLTISGKCAVTLCDEPDGDIGIDPYYSDRDNRNQGTFFRKLLARNPNYQQRRIRRYKGFTGLSYAEYIQTFEGVVETITFGDDNTVTIEAGDLFTRLEDIEIPATSDVKLNTEIDASTTAIAVSDGTKLDSSGYIRVDDEIIAYTGLSENTLSGVTRGSFSTTAAVHFLDASVQQVRYYSPQSPYDILTTMLLTDGGLDAAYVDSAAFTDIKALDANMVLFEGIITEPKSLRDLYFEIIDLIDCKSWVGEDLKITIAKNLPNHPGRSYQTITDADNIVINSDGVDMNMDSRISRITLYWHKNPVGRDDDLNSYLHKDQVIDTDGEGVNLYNKSVEKVIYCRWLRTSYMDEDFIYRYIDNLLRRMLRLYRDPMPIYSFSAELKDSAIRTGDYVKISTDKIVDIYGAGIANKIFQVTKRQGDKNLITFSALQYPVKKVFFVGPPNIVAWETGIEWDDGIEWAYADDYTSTGDAEKEYGCLCNSQEEMSNGDPAYYLY